MEKKKKRAKSGEKIGAVQTKQTAAVQSRVATSHSPRTPSNSNSRRGGSRVRRYDGFTIPFCARIVTTVNFRSRVSNCRRSAHG